jgi:NAD(P)-dependent dehydrogenase (short-subunit alcohol dehydrogenase family)
MTTFADRVALITGAGNGIGRELARQLAAEGARIAAIDRQAESLDSLAQELKGRPIACAAADVTDTAGLAAAVAQLEERLGPTDLVIANAGIFRPNSARDFRAEDFAAQVNVNLIGVANTVAAVLPGMRRRRAGQIVAISSLAAFRGLPFMAGYCASKSGVNALCEALRTELRPYGIAVTTVCPSFIRTDIGGGAEVANPPKMMDVTPAVARMLAGIRRRRPLVAFPAAALWKLRLLRLFPQAAADRRVLRDILRSWRGDR